MIESQTGNGQQHKRSTTTFYHRDMEYNTVQYFNGCMIIFLKSKMSEIIIKFNLYGII